MDLISHNSKGERIGREREGNMEEIIELLQCASINCDNVKKIGIQFADFVKIQIDEAIEKLEKLTKEN